MIGLNRVFYESGMDALYEYFSVDDADDRVQTLRLKELHKESVALRVQHLRIAPLFLPVADNEGNPIHQANSALDANFIKQTMKVLIPHLITKSFCDFINTLVFKSCSGIRELLLDVTLDQFRVLPSLSSQRSLTPNLTSVSLQIGTSTRVLDSLSAADRDSSASKSLLYFASLLNNTKHTLTNLTIISFAFVDSAPLFRHLEHFTSLKYLYFRYWTNTHSFSLPKYFGRLFGTSPSIDFLGLESVCMSDLFIFMFRRDAERHSSPEFRFPEMGSFDFSSFASAFAIYSRNLKHLIFDSRKGLSDLQLQQLLTGIGGSLRKQDLETQLEILELRRLQFFSAAHLDSILRALPHIKKLVIGYYTLDVDPFRVPSSKSKEKWSGEALSAFRTQKYPTSFLHDPQVGKRTRHVDG
ncbi:hypothetical protein NP233_g1422 [Leucocoprinus birnbaumii]|uniref:Uncharacterized protein n=1 Tax=Leucocoprinus birnbaumii TaxID=56174 RepID=A0AAD5VZX9_9AGAR|nr:hypothetical protein NP233_g1422 [Leucocoprinus birnbaumii]